jgi:hypothetical protein
VLISVSSLKQKGHGLEAQIAELWQTKMTREEAIAICRTARNSSRVSTAS